MLFHSTARGGLVFAVRRVFVARNCVGQPSESIPKNANTNPPLASSPLFLSGQIDQVFKFLVKCTN